MKNNHTYNFWDFIWHLQQKFSLLLKNSIAYSYYMCYYKFTTYISIF